MVQLTPDYPGPRPGRWLYLRSFLPYLLLVLTLAFGLSSYSLLSHFRGPAEKQQIGWQAYDTIEVHHSAGAGAGEDVVTSGNGTSASGQQKYVPSLPLDNWDPLAFHTTGLTEIAVKPCYFPPFLFGSYCAPESTGELDKTKGKWVIVEKDLNSRTGLWYLNVYYRRTRRLDVPLISDIRIVAEPPPPELSAELEGWIKAEGNLHSGIWPTQPEMRLWYKLEAQGWMAERSSDPAVGSPAEVRQSVDYSYGEMITEVDVVYGDDDPFYGFERVQGGPFTATKQDRWGSVDIAVRRGTYSPPKANRPRFHNDGTYKIMQIADLHYSVGNGACKDTDKEPCVGDPETQEWLGHALDIEMPDLVVFSGDQLNGQETSYDARSVLAKFAKPVVDRQIPWAAIFGNHDSEIDDDRAEQMRTLMNMPYSLAQAGPEDVDGVGNYLIKLYSGDASRTHIFTLYFLDSHAYEPKALPWAKADYDWIKESQIKWFLNASHSIKPIERPFRPDGANDLGHIWARGPSRLEQQRQTRFAKPNAIMWFHIPLPEAQNDADTAGFDAEELSVGDAFDRAGNSKHNGGMFYNGIKQAYDNDEAAESESELERVTEVKVLGHGHSHNTDRCRRIDGIWMCFDGGSSFSGYGQLGFDRRVRIYTLADYGETVHTYKRLTSGEIIDQQILVGTGAPEGVGMDQVNF